MVVVFPYGTCAICDGGLSPRATYRPSRPRTVCDSPECLREAHRYGAAKMNAKRSRRAQERTEYPCPQCSRTLPLDTDHFYVDKRHPDGSVARFSRWCKDCKREYQRVHRDVAAETGLRRARHERLRQELAGDPDLRERVHERQLQRQRDYRRRHPDTIRAQRERADERVKADPDRLRRRRENRRIAARLRKERQGLPMNQRERHERERDEHLVGVRMPRVPAKPLGDALERRLLRALREDPDDSRDAIAEAWGTTDRQIRAWRDGERVAMMFDVADGLLVATGLCAFDVWDDPAVVGLWDRR